MNVPDNYKNLREIASASQKSLSNWVDKPSGKNAIAAFAKSHPEIENPIITKRGKGGGTYAHPELAAIFAAWCDPQFPGFQQKVIEFQRTKIQAMLPFIPDDVIQQQIASGETNRAINLLSENDAGGNIELIADWFERNKQDPRSDLVAKRMIESNGNLKPGHTYGKTYGFKSREYKVGFQRWDDFECLLARLQPKYNLPIEKVIELLDEIDNYVI